jgi:hypothetical protein
MLPYALLMLRAEPQIRSGQPGRAIAVRLPGKSRTVAGNHELAARTRHEHSHFCVAAGAPGPPGHRHKPAAHYR